MLSLFFFFNDTATTEIYTLSLHDALPIYGVAARGQQAAEATGHLAVRPGDDDAHGSGDRGDGARDGLGDGDVAGDHLEDGDRKSTRLNSSHANISYAVFCLKKKKNICNNI